MKLYRYRPLNQLLYKELLYSELYLASSEELNDPLDLHGQLNFFSEDENRIKALVGFLSKQMFMLCFSYGGLSDTQISMFVGVKNLFNFERLGKYIVDEFKKYDNKIITKNDLFEILFSYYNEKISNTAFMEALGNSRAEELFDSLDKLFAQFLSNSRVVCFSKNHTNFLMWSHYASGHTGMCLEFEVDIDKDDSNIGYLPVTLPAHLLSKTDLDPKTFSWKEKVSAVRYPASLSKLNFYDFLPIFHNKSDVDLVNLSKSYWHPYARRIENSYFEKLEPWRDEEEWRIVNVSFKDTIPEEQILRFDDDALTGVYFGAKSSISTQKRVKNIIKYTNCAPTYYQCSVDGTRKIYAELMRDDEEL